MVDTSKLIGHHKIALSPANINYVSIALNKDNAELICFDCHNKVHRGYGYGPKCILFMAVL